MISPTRSRDLISGGLAALLAALESPEQAGPEAVVHADKLAVRVGPRLVAGYRFAGADYRSSVMFPRELPRRWRGLG